MIALLKKTKGKTQEATRVRPLSMSQETTVTIDKSSIDKLIDVCNQMIAGDIEARVIGVEEGHPLKALAEAINRTLDLMDSYTRESATAIEYCSNDKFYRPLLPQGLPGVFGRCATVINKGGRRMRDSHRNFVEIADLAEENSSSVNTIAAACEELSATNEEITRSAQSSVESSHLTAQQAHELSGSVKRMESALSDIDSTVNMIEHIAQQTSLLALNAMIEASRAGAKGSRFEVVANEVKDLAKSTSAATDQIKAHVGKIHSIAEDTGQSFEKIESSIKAIEASSNLIKNSLMNQVAATQEVTYNINDVAQNMVTVTDKIRNLKEAKS